MPQKNTLLIGVGGTGCEVVRDLKKKLHVEWRNRGAEAKQIDDVFEFEAEFGGRQFISRIATLSVDSNEGDLAGQGKRDQWISLGEEITLTKREQVLIDSSAVRDVASDLELYPGVSPWLRKDNERDFLVNITTGLTPLAGCNQLRRLGRLALASGGNVGHFLTGVSGRLEQLCKGNGQVDVDIHIAGSIATGTGGGTMLDIVAQLQAYLSRQPWTSRLYIHAFTTSVDVGDKNTGRFYINQYAALKEFNAFNRSFYKPWDINNPPESKRLSIKPAEQDPNDTKYYDLKETFKSLFLITETTDSGTRVNLDQQIDSVAELLFQLAVRQLGDIPNEIRMALSNEDNAETTDEGFSGVRSVKFASYGVHRVVIPETKIRQQLSTAVGLQFTLQLLHNNWVKTFLDDALPFSGETFVGNTVKAWEVHKSDLWQDKTTGDTKYPDEKKFKPYQTDWQLKLEEIAAETKKAETYKEMQDWLTEFNRKAEHYWDEEFRILGDKGGVERYFSYHGSRAELEKRAARVAAHIEANLLESMENCVADYTIHNLPEMVEILIKRIEAESMDFSKKSPGYEKLSKASDARRTKIKNEFGKIGIISHKLSGKAERLFGQYQAESEIFYSNRTYERAAKYGADFCTTLLEKLRLLRKEVGDFKLNIVTLKDNLAIERAVRPIEQSGTEDYVDWDEIETSIQGRFESDRDNLEINRNHITQALQLLRGDRREFHAYNKEMKLNEKTNTVIGAFPDIVRKLSMEYSRPFHDSVVEKYPDFKPFFGRNIIKELFEEYREVTPALQERLEGWIRRSSPMVAFDSSQPRPKLPKPGPRKRRLLLLPTCQAVPEDFRNALRNRALAAVGNTEGDMVVRDMAEERCPNEISIMTVAFFFPARQARIVSALKREYDDAMVKKKEGAFNYYQIHTESLQFPDLMLPSRAEELQNKLPWVLAATALGFMQLPDDVELPVYIGTRADELGPIENRIETGLTLLQENKDRIERAKEQYKTEVALELELLYSSYSEQFKRESCVQVEDLLNKKADAGRLAEAEGQLDAYKKGVFLLARRNEQDEKYNKYVQAIEEAKSVVIPFLREQR